MSLDPILGEVRRDGEARAQAILADARKEAQAILAAAREKAKAVEAARLADAARDAQAVASQAQSRAESEARKAVLAAEADLRTQLRASILKALADLPAKSRERHLKSLLDKAKAIVPAGKVWGSDKDAAWLKAQKAYAHGGSTGIAGGLVVESDDGKVRLDLSYETLLDEAWRDVLRSEAALFS